jgi:hypothetical protein
MPFEAKRLRVQLPCGEVTVFDEVPAGLHVIPTTWCPLPSRVPIEVIETILCQQSMCGPGSAEVVVDPGSLVVSPEQLVTLRGQLEARLAMVTEAEQAVAAARASEK